MNKYTATKSPGGQGREAWTIIFRHPVKRDAAGKSGLRVRRGLGTSVESEAQQLVNQMNEILNDQSLWDLSAKGKALAKYHPRIVAAFYDPMEPKMVDYWAVRENAIPLPGAAEGYAKVLLLGTTGCGKTTLLRQFIGADPKKDRFPSTSTAKTTVSDMEVICSPGDFEGVVTFFQESEVRLHLEDNVVAAVLANISGQDKNTVKQKLLDHVEQRFRFSYILGNDLGQQPQEELDDFEVEGEDQESDEDEADFITAEDRQAYAARLRYFLDRVAQIGDASRKELGNLLELDTKTLSAEDREAFEELLDYQLRQNKDLNKDLQALVDELLDEIQLRFDDIASGELEYGDDDWPTHWTFGSDERDVFIRTIKRFSSNFAPHFGKLLTPLVQGIRVKGPFQPIWHGEIPRLVLLDGQGLGHTPDTMGSLPTTLTKRFDLSDAILLVDNAAQPMQASALTVFRSVVAGGYTRKLQVCFTHLDAVRGDNLPSTQSKIAHVRASLGPAISYVAEVVGSSLARNLERELGTKCYFLARIQENLPDTAQWTRAEIQRLVKDLENCVELPALIETVPEYDEANLIIAVQSAINRYHAPWNARLGTGVLAGVNKEHWTRIRALTRRLATTPYDEYDYLRPVADLVARLSEHISSFLSQPVRWSNPYATDDDKNLAIERIAQEAFKALHELASHRVWRSRTSSWNEAYEFTGTGSGGKRSKAVQGILQLAAPVLNEVPTGGSPEFLAALRSLVRSAIVAGGGRFTGAIHEQGA